LPLALSLRNKQEIAQFFPQFEEDLRNIKTGESFWWHLDNLDTLNFGLTLNMVSTLLECFDQLSEEKLFEVLQLVYSTFYSYQIAKELDLKKFAEFSIFAKPKEVLKKIINSESTKKECKDMALKTYVLLACKLDNPEDILLSYNLVKKFNPKLNIYAELCLNEDFKKLKESESNLIQEEFTYQDEDDVEEEKTQANFDANPNMEFTKVIQNLSSTSSSDSDPIDLTNIDSITFDEQFAYVIHTSYGLVKLGKSDKEGIEKGKLYAHEKKWSGTKYTILCLNSYLFLRPCIQQEDCKLPDDAREFEEHPFLIFKTDDLSTPVNGQFMNVHKATKRNLEKDHWNKPILEWINYSKVAESVSRHNLDEYRVLLDTPMATEGKYIYTLAFYIKDISNLNSPLTKMVVEKYCSITWKCLKEIPLNLTLQEPSETSREIEELFLHHAIGISNLMNSPFDFLNIDRSSNVSIFSYFKV
jgi:hypothetical protein